MNNNREAQLALAGAVTAIETMLDNKYIKEEDVQKVTDMMNGFKSRITLQDILFSIEESRK